MRLFTLAVAGLFVTGALAQQQSQPAVPALDPNRSRLDALLMQWEEKMKTLQSVSATVVREKEDKVFQSRETFEGQARYMRPNLALLDLRMRGRPGVFEKYIFTGTYLYEYHLGTKEVRIHELPPPKPGQVADDNFLSFLFGMKAEEAKRRYDLRLAGEDKYYVYLEVVPRFPADKADFQKAQLVLNQGSMLPRMLTFTEANGNRVKWDIPAVESGTRLDRNEFTAPTLPPGWKARRMPKVTDPQAQVDPNLPPRVVRPKE
jgi:TIGR03009 family protein